MGEADGNEKLLVILRREFGADPLAIGGGTQAEIDGHIKNGAPQAAHKLGLPVGRRLEMQAANGSLWPGQGLVILHEGGVDAAGG